MNELGKGYIEVSRIAEKLGWPTHRARRWLKRQDAVVKVGSRYYTTRGKLRAVFPDVFEELFIGEF